MTRSASAPSVARLSRRLDAPSAARPAQYGSHARPRLDPRRSTTRLRRWRRRSLQSGIFLLIPVAMYFLLIRPQRRRQQEQAALQAAIERRRRGDDHVGHVRLHHRVRRRHRLARDRRERPDPRRSRGGPAQGRHRRGRSRACRPHDDSSASTPIERRRRHRRQRPTSNAPQAARSRWSRILRRRRSAASLAALDRPATSRRSASTCRAASRSPSSRSATTTRQSLDLAVERIRDRVDSLGVAEPEIIRQGDAIVVNLPGVEEPAGGDRARPGDRPGVPASGAAVRRRGRRPTPTTTTDHDGHRRRHRPPARPTRRAPRDASTPPASTATTVSPGPSRRRRHGRRHDPPADDTIASTGRPTASATTTAGSSDDARPRRRAPRPPSAVRRPRRSPIPVDPIDTATPTIAAAVGPELSPQVLPLQRRRVVPRRPAAGGTGDGVRATTPRPTSSGGGWGVTVGLRDGADGDRRLERARAASASPARPDRARAGRLAIELDGVIVSAPTRQRSRRSPTACRSPAASARARPRTSPAC